MKGIKIQDTPHKSSSLINIILPFKPNPIFQDSPVPKLTLPLFNLKRPSLDNERSLTQGPTAPFSVHPFHTLTHVGFHVKAELNR